MAPIRLTTSITSGNVFEAVSLVLSTLENGSDATVVAKFVGGVLIFYTEVVTEYKDISVSN